MFFVLLFLRWCYCFMLCYVLLLWYVVGYVIFRLLFFDVICCFTSLFGHAVFCHVCFFNMWFAYVMLCLRYVNLKAIRCLRLCYVLDCVFKNYVMSSVMCFLLCDCFRWFYFSGYVFCSLCIFFKMFVCLFFWYFVLCYLLGYVSFGIVFFLWSVIL